MGIFKIEVIFDKKKKFLKVSKESRIKLIFQHLSQSLIDLQTLFQWIH